MYTECYEKLKQNRSKEKYEYTVCLMSTSVVLKEAVLCVQMNTAFHTAKLCVFVAVLAAQLFLIELDQVTDTVKADVTCRLSELSLPFVSCKQ